ncbi:MAG TPA: Mpo1-like protein [Thermoanaerobaculia bacterium]|nr:Mpo1-like protein [Thermoanaerobaculia bacterium]
MRRIHTLFADYASFHQTRGNKACHRAGIPLIMLSLFGMLALARLNPNHPHLNAAVLLIAASTVYYFVLEPRLALVMLAVSAAMYLAALHLPLWLLVALFVVGWILQGVGHAAYEKKAPAFAKNLVHLMIGPLWIANDLVKVVH